MKNLLLILFAFFYSLASFAQLETEKPTLKVDSKEYETAKLNGLLDQFNVSPFMAHETYDISAEDAPKIKKKPINTVPSKASGCNCYVEPDSTYLLALAPNDDGSSSAITIPFPFCFYGDTVTTMYINNNGNITFGSPMSTYSATAFPSSGPQIIAPFWGDVDTRGGNGQVLYKVTPTAIYINWYHVGYFSIQGDKLNNFQLIITNGSDPAIDGGNVAFCYEDMQWTTGSASSGVNGFGGVPATAGANKGNGINFFLIARFDHPGTDFDGALGNPDGISWLDNKSFFFDVCSYINIPPVPNGASSCDTFRVCSIGDTADIQFIFLSPEATQSTSIVINPGTLTNLQVITNVPGNTAYTVLRVPGAAAFVGTHTVEITATDNGTPTGITTLYLTVIIDSAGTANFNPILSPVTGCDSILVDVLNGPYDSYLWDNLLLDSSIYVSSALQNFGVTVSKNGCFKRIDTNFLVSPSFNISLIGNPELCPGILTSNFAMPDSLNYGPATWGLTNAGLDSLYSNNLGVGTYTISVTDTFGVCTVDTTFTVTALPAISLQPDDTICGQSYVFTGNTGGTGSGIWSFVSTGSNPVFQSTANMNTTVILGTTGIYDLIYTDNFCIDDDTVRITVMHPFTAASQLSGSPFYCPGEAGANMVVTDSLHFGSITWNNPNATNGIFNQTLPPGTYTVTLVDTLGQCSSSTTFTVTTQPAIVLMSDTVICGNTVVMNANSGGSGTGSWSIVSGPGVPVFQSATALNQTVTFPVGVYGFYVLKYTDANCPDSDEIQVFYSPPPAIVFNNVDFFICPGDFENVILTDTLTLAQASWDSGAQTGFISFLTAGTHTVEVTNLSGCTNDSTFTILTQIVTQLLEHPEACGDVLDLNGNIGLDNGLWSKISGPGTATFNPIDSIQTVVTWSKPGTYTIMYTEPICLQPDTITINVTFYPYSEVGNEVGCLGIAQTVTAYSVWDNVTSYEWSDGQTGSTATFTVPGYYYLTSTNACGTHVWDFYYDAHVCDIVMPNVFTPNGDLINMMYGPIGADPAGLSSFNCKLFNRWGNLMYEFTDVTKGWDGRTSNGNFADDGVYFYKIEAKDIEGKSLDKQGFFHLVQN
ncbi:MAG: nidogen-like domain-containing protein [Crocinitomicaceae bacterium]